MPWLFSVCPPRPLPSPYPDHPNPYLIPRQPPTPQPAPQASHKKGKKKKKVPFCLLQYNLRQFVSDIYCANFIELDMNHTRLQGNIYQWVPMDYLNSQICPHLTSSNSSITVLAFSCRYWLLVLTPTAVSAHESLLW